MKIGDIKVGTTYAATDGKRRSYSGDLPRRVEALEIVTQEQEVWVGGGYTAQRATRNQRKVKVRVLDEPRYPESWHHERVMTAPEGTELVLEARFLAAPWSEVRSDVLAKIRDDQAKADAEARTEGRIRALLPKRMQDDHIYITAHKWHGQPVRTRRSCDQSGALMAVGYDHAVEVKLEGRVLDAILALAEKGAAS